MHIKNKPPVFVPARFQAEIATLSKAALMDIAWDYAQQISGGVSVEDEVMSELRARREIIEIYRKRK